MLFTPYLCGLETLFDNFGSDLEENNIGVSIPADVTAHVKSSVVELFSTSTITKDCYGIGMYFTGGSVNGECRKYLVDILIDPAGGTNWQVLIPNLFLLGPGFGGYSYYFPLQVPAGASIGARTQSNVGSANLRVAVQLFGEPSRKEAMRFGTFVEAFGVNEATTSGVSITSGDGVMGSWVELGTTQRQLWFWQHGGIGSDDITQTNGVLYCDLAYGDATFKHHLITKCIMKKTSAEQATKDAFGLGPCTRTVPPGSTIYARSGTSSSVDTGEHTIGYGVG